VMSCSPGRLTSDSVIFGYHAKSESSERFLAKGLLPFNAIETPRILLNSASSRYAEGLANSSGQVGRNYMRHMNGAVWAVFDKPVRDVPQEHDGWLHQGRAIS
jgi:hypothetical protein